MGFYGNKNTHRKLFPVSSWLALRVKKVQLIFKRELGVTRNTRDSNAVFRCIARTLRQNLKMIFILHHALHSAAGSTASPIFAGTGHTEMPSILK